MLDMFNDCVQWSEFDLRIHRIENIEPYVV